MFRWGLILLSFLISRCQPQSIADGASAGNWTDFRQAALDRTNPAYRADILQILQQIVYLLGSSSFPTAVNPQVTQKCRQDSLAYVAALTNLTKWALEMRESSGRFPDGFFGGLNVHSLGLFDECLAVKAPDFRGQYCAARFIPVRAENVTTVQQKSTNWITVFQLVRLVFGLNQTIEPLVTNSDYYSAFLPTLGLCIPSSCTADDFRSSVARLVGGYVLANQTILTISDDKNCYVESKPNPPFDGPAVAVLVTLSTLGSLAVISTAHETVRLLTGKPIGDKDGGLVRLLHCFSTVNTCRKVLSTERRSSDLSCIHGIRFLSTTWVLMGHCWMFSTLVPNLNRQFLLRDGYKWEVQAISNATVSVDTFLFLSGLLVCYLLLVELDRSRGRFNVVLFYVHRYLRLTPVYAIILGFLATLVVYLGSSPNWSTVHYIAEGCRTDWWKHLLYVDNLILPRLESCMRATWYMNVDMQLFVVSPLIVYPLWKWKKAGLLWLCGLTVASMVGNFVVFAVYDLQPVAIPTRPAEDTIEFTENYYNKPWTRAPPYLVGIFIGWWLHKARNVRIVIATPIVVVGWALAAALGVSIVYGLTPYVDMTVVPEIPQAVKMSYGPLHRFAWSLAVAWVVVTCIHGYGGVVQQLLSWKGFMPLSRLTYVAYLIHIDYYSVFYSHARQPMYYTVFSQVHTYLGFVVAVFGLSFVIVLFVEAPLLNLEKLAFSFRRGRKAVEKTVQSQRANE